MCVNLKRPSYGGAHSKIKNTVQSSVSRSNQWLCDSVIAEGAVVYYREGAGLCSLSA